MFTWECLSGHQVGPTGIDRAPLLDPVLGPVVFREESCLRVCRARPLLAGSLASQPFQNGGYPAP